jgi:hypothetical protein
LFDAPPERNPPSPVARRSSRERWRDPQSGYIRRNVSPPRWPSPIRIVEVEFPAGATVSYETSDREVDIHQQVWVLSGQIEVSVGGETHHLEAGDCLALCLDQPITYRNRTVRSTRYAVVIVAGQTSSRRTA